MTAAQVCFCNNMLLLFDLLIIYLFWKKTIKIRTNISMVQFTLLLCYFPYTFVYIKSGTKKHYWRTEFNLWVETWQKGNPVEVILMFSLLT